LHREVVEAIEGFRLKLTRVRGMARQDAVGKAPHIHDVEADNVDAELGQAGSDLRSIFLARKIRAERQIHAKEPDAIRAGVKMSVLAGAHVSKLAGWFGQPTAEVGNARGRIVPWQHKREQGRR
jgi:hypothetical protein